MGNSQNKLEKKFSSLPSQNFPSPQKEDSNFFRKLVRASKRGRHSLRKPKSQRSESSPEKGHGSRYPVPLTDALFQPEYPVKSDIDEQDFEFIEVIARGAFGDVLKIRRIEDKIVYAMKTMKKSKVIVDGAVQQCKDEAVIQNAVGHHPFIVKPYYFFQNKEHVYIVMEYIPRGELFEAWKYLESFTEDLVQLYILELAMVIDFLHRAGIIYRDLKMENILIDAQGHLQVIDFGLAKWLKKGRRTKTICGTLQYIAPEVLNMQPYGHTSDWWSLGILMYALLQGEYPVSGCKNHFDMARKVHEHVYELPSGVGYSYTKECRQCLSKLLCRNPAERTHDLQTIQREPWFDGIDCEALIHRRLCPDIFLASQGDYGYSLMTRSRSTSMATSLDDDPNSSRQRCHRMHFNWNESVASLDASFV